MPPIKELHHFDDPGSRAPKAQSLLERAQKDLAKLNGRRGDLNKTPLSDRDVAFLQAFVDLGDQIDIERYARLFDARGDQYTGDITPGYSSLKRPMIREVTERFPEAKFIYMARNPVDRFWSQYNMRRRKGKVAANPGKSHIRRFIRKEGVAMRSLPSRNVTDWRDHLPEERFALFFFDDLVSDPVGLRTRVLTFLGASPEEGRSISSSFNRKAELPKLPLDPDTRKFLASLFADELKAAADVLGGPAVEWLRADGPGSR